MPARVLMQDFTGVPAVVDLAAMRDAMADIGGDPARVEPLVPADLVIDHSVQVDRFRTPDAFAFNVEREYERNGERYQLLRWAQTRVRRPARRAARHRHRPPGQPRVPRARSSSRATRIGETVAFPDTLVGTDSHTTMVNGLGVLGYGVGGIEAEAVLLGQPLYQPMPRVVGVRLHGELPRGSTATDLVLVDLEHASHSRRRGLVRRVRGRRPRVTGVGRPGNDLQHVARVRRDRGPLPDRRSRRCAYLRRPAGRTSSLRWSRRTPRRTRFWREPGPGPDFDETLELDLATVEPTVAGPRRPQDKVRLPDLPGQLPRRLSADGRLESRSRPLTHRRRPQTRSTTALSRSPRSPRAPTRATRR